MQRNLLIILLFLISSSCFGQKLYVWCPNEQVVKPRLGFLENQEVNVVFFDGRSIPEKSKIECWGVDIITSLQNIIRKAYPSAKINLLTESAYYKKAEDGKITIKVGIAAYQAGFGTDVTVGIGSVGGNFSYVVATKGQWNGLTSYYVQIFDNRNNAGKKYDKEISHLDSKSNLWGYKTAKVCLNSSYTEANQDLLFFIEKSLME